MDNRNSPGADRVKLWHFMYNGLIFFLLLYMYYFNLIRFPGLVFRIVCLGLLTFYSWKTLQNLYYTFWTIIFFQGIYLIYLLTSHGPWSHLADNGLFFGPMLALLFLGIEVSILYSPLYYPVIGWWEYDFRYRHELKGSLQCFDRGEDKSYGLRITDIRRFSACLSVFADFPLGKRFKATIEDFSETSFTVEAVSKRRSSIGRPYIYGIKFILLDTDKEKAYEQLSRFWSEEKRRKLAQKFGESWES